MRSSSPPTAVAATPARNQPPEDPKPSLGQRASGLSLAVLTRVLRWSPAWMAYGFARCAAPVLVWLTDRRERRVGPLGRGLVRNQRIVCRETWDATAARTHMRAWAHHMTQSFVDFCRMPRIQADNLHELVDLGELDKLRAVHAKGKGVICASGHMGLWELGGHVFALAGLPTASVSRPSKNPAVEQVLRKIRRSGGQQLITKWGALFPIHKTLKRGEMVGIAADEDASTYSVFAPFLGTLASTSTTPTMIAKRTGSPIAVVTFHRVGRGRFKLHVWDVIPSLQEEAAPRTGAALQEEAALRKEAAPQGEAAPQTEAAPATSATSEGPSAPVSTPQQTLGDGDGLPRCPTTERISEALSHAILTYPEQWLWGSRRFTTRPEGERPDPDGLPPRCKDWSEPSILQA